MTTPATLDESELDEIYSFATQLAKRAGQMLLDAVDARSGQTGGASHVEKESAVDLVTQTDEGESFSRLTSQASGCNLFPLLISIVPSPQAAQLGEDRTSNVTTRPYIALFAGPSCMNFLCFLLTRWPPRKMSRPLFTKVWKQDFLLMRMLSTIITLGTSPCCPRARMTDCCQVCWRGVVLQGPVQAVPHT